MNKYDDKIIFKPSEFNYTNANAKIVIVGITPGNSQLANSREEKSLREIKQENAFAGNMRPNLIAMLNHIGINDLLGIRSCETLWGEDFDQVEMTSLLKDATYVINKKGKEEMFKDTSKIFKSPKLSNMLDNGFKKDCNHYKNVKLFIACGPGVYSILKQLYNDSIISAPVVGIAHPSGANMGRIQQYLGKGTNALDNSYVWCSEKAAEAQATVNTLLSSAYPSNK